MQVLPLQKGIIYGIVRSRRLKSSLGINLSPTEFKLCSFNCVYCHYGFTEVQRTTAEGYRDQFPAPQDVEEALWDALRTFTETPLYITFSGNGEPSMHPDFPDIVDRVINVRNKHNADIQTAILSNSTTAHIPEARQAILKLDLPIMKLDAGDRETFQQVNRPAKDIDLDTIIESLANMPDITLQSCLVQGSVSNSQNHQIDNWIDQIAHIHPREVQAYTLDRPPADSGLVPVPHRRMEHIVQLASERSGVPVTLFGPRQT
jgi:wyosine [tRNA(Phe)-imidazoG37] synthetase (radical SAM superfamily)